MNLVFCRRKGEVFRFVEIIDRIMLKIKIVASFLERDIFLLDLSGTFCTLYLELILLKGYSAAIRILDIREPELWTIIVNIHMTERITFVPVDTNIELRKIDAGIFTADLGLIFFFEFIAIEIRTSFLESERMNLLVWRKGAGIQEDTSLCPEPFLVDGVIIAADLCKKRSRRFIFFCQPLACRRENDAETRHIVLDLDLDDNVSCIFILKHHDILFVEVQTIDLFDTCILLKNIQQIIPPPF